MSVVFVIVVDVIFVIVMIYVVAVVVVVVNFSKLRKSELWLVLVRLLIRERLKLFFEILAHLKNY